MIFDTHTHYDDRRFDEDREALFAALKEQKIGRIVNVGASLSGCRRSLELAAAHDFIYAAVGVHPDEVSELEKLGGESACRLMRELLSASKTVAVGEIGLDYHGDYPDKLPADVQQKWFRFQLELAREQKLPVVIHSRDAAQDTYDLIREAGGPELSMDIHCFSYEKEMAKLYLDMGYYLGIGGVVTYKNGRKLKDVVKYMPIDRILLETDCPYLSPEPKRGTRNSSLNLPFVIAEIARLKEITAEEVEEAAWQNACRFYRLHR